MTGPRWAGVGVTMEAGKWMGEACKRIVVTFRHPEQCLCDGVEHVANKIVFTMEPNDQIEICFFAKRVGLRGRGRGAPLHLLPLREDREGPVRRGVRQAHVRRDARRPDALRLDARGRCRLELHRPDRRRVGGGRGRARLLRGRRRRGRQARRRGPVGEDAPRAGRRGGPGQDGRGTRAQPGRQRLGGRRLQPPRRRRARDGAPTA